VSVKVGSDMTDIMALGEMGVARYRLRSRESEVHQTRRRGK
jgi:hypothetical protein